LAGSGERPGFSPDRLPSPQFVSTESIRDFTDLSLTGQALTHQDLAEEKTFVCKFDCIARSGQRHRE
jgi:hypothetical protein